MCVSSRVGWVTEVLFVQGRGGKQAALSCTFFPRQGRASAQAPSLLLTHTQKGELREPELKPGCFNKTTAPAAGRTLLCPLRHALFMGRSKRTAPCPMLCPPAARAAE